MRENGTKVSLVSSLHYDAMAQPNDPFISPIDLLPGDRIVTTCVYDTSGDKDAVVWGTRKQQDEMCYGSMYYYPAGTSITCVNLQGRYNTQVPSYPVWCCTRGAWAYRDQYLVVMML